MKILLTAAVTSFFFLCILYFQSSINESVSNIKCTSRIIELQIKEAQKTADEIIKRLR